MIGTYIRGKVLIIISVTLNQWIKKSWENVNDKNVSGLSILPGQIEFKHGYVLVRPNMIYDSSQQCTWKKIY